MEGPEMAPQTPQHSGRPGEAVAPLGHRIPVTIRFVGSGDSFGSGGRFQTCIVVDGPGVRFAIDPCVTPKS